MFCDCCGDLVTASVPIEVKFPDGAEITINVCLDCWWRYFEKSRKHRVAKLLEVLMEG